MDDRWNKEVEEKEERRVEEKDTGKLRKYEKWENCIQEERKSNENKEKRLVWVKFLKIKMFSKYFLPWGKKNHMLLTFLWYLG